MPPTQAQGFGRQRGHTEVYRRGDEVDFVPKLRIEILVDDCQEAWRMRSLRTVTGKIGDGKERLPVETWLGGSVPESCWTDAL